MGGRLPGWRKSARQDLFKRLQTKYQAMDDMHGTIVEHGRRRAASVMKVRADARNVAVNNRKKRMYDVSKRARLNSLAGADAAARLELVRVCDWTLTGVVGASTGCSRRAMVWQCLVGIKIMRTILDGIREIVA